MAEKIGIVTSKGFHKSKKVLIWENGLTIPRYDSTSETNEWIAGFSILDTNGNVIDLTEKKLEVEIRVIGDDTLTNLVAPMYLCLTGKVMSATDCEPYDNSLFAYVDLSHAGGVIDEIGRIEIYARPTSLAFNNLTRAAIEIRRIYEIIE